MAWPGTRPHEVPLNEELTMGEGRGLNTVLISSVHSLSTEFVRHFFKDCAFILGVPTIPLLPPQVNQSFTSVPSMNPATTLPGEQQKTRDVRNNDSITDILHLKKTTTKV